MEKYYAFLKDGIVVNVSVFANEDQALADAIAAEQGFDEAIWTDTKNVAIGSIYDGIDFITPEAMNEATPK